MLRVVCVLVVIWYVLWGLALWVDCSCMLKNTISLDGDDTKVIVAQEGETFYVGMNIGYSAILLKDDILYFNDDTTKELSEMADYIRTAPGCNMYYVPDNHLSVPYTVEELAKNGACFYILGIVVFVMTILFARSVKRKKDIKLYGLSFLVVLLALGEMIVSIMYSYSYYWYNSKVSNTLFCMLMCGVFAKMLFTVTYNVKGRE